MLPGREGPSRSGRSRRWAQEPVDRPAAAAAIADVLDDARQPALSGEGRCRGVVRGQEPALDRLPAETGEGDVPDVDGTSDPRRSARTGRQRVRSGVGQRSGPEGVEVGRLLAIRRVDAQLGERQIEEHAFILLSASGPVGRRLSRLRPRSILGTGSLSRVAAGGSEDGPDPGAERPDSGGSMRPALRPRCTVPRMIRVGSIVLRVDNLRRQTEFWSSALGYVARPDEATTSCCCAQEQAGGRTSPSTGCARSCTAARIHLDLYTEDQAGEVERLKALGPPRSSGTDDRSTPTTSSSPIRKATASASWTSRGSRGRPRLGRGQHASPSVPDDAGRAGRLHAGR